jgi:hypothetical protein
LLTLISKGHGNGCGKNNSPALLASQTIKTQVAEAPKAPAMDYDPC